MKNNITINASKRFSIPSLDAKWNPEKYKAVAVTKTTIACLMISLLIVVGDYNLK